jgi:hypothetical protein
VKQHPNNMNTMMPISHRLYAAAVADKQAPRGARTASPVIIEMVRRGLASWPKARRGAAQPVISRAAWGGARA